ncbi:lipoate--protein ligase family protein [Marinobacterium arenosum]|uniref:lipoate--protein ligase family protein n=1 Tax=Marinobacterium arenosum TaxID=2862496 RepID=UPI001C952B12|nr:lipoate--protein ligase family protein [Marinobacterium arenosum]MBY4675022.1 lipoate--protein ligase family protein [Marinobacterium arenosum]
MHALTIEPPTTVTELPLLNAEEGLRREIALLDAVANGEQPAGFLIWRCRQALVVPRSLARKPNFAAVGERLAAQGWPLVLRQTGGDLTPQAPGLINVALVFRQRRCEGAIRDSYLRLCQPLIDALQSLGVQAYCASVQGAFCDGDYNLVVDGRKLAGTAQRWRRLRTASGADEHAVLAQAVILADESLARLWQVGNQFYRLCEMPQRIDAGRHTSLAELLPVAGERLIELVRWRLEQSLRSWLAQQNLPETTDRTDQ